MLTASGKVIFTLGVSSGTRSQWPEGLDGPPHGATDVLGLYFYRTAFGGATSGLQDFGRASALAVLMFVFIAGAAVFATRRLRRREIEL